MEPTWLYVVIAIVAITAAILFKRLVPDALIRHRIAAWLLILAGMAMFIVAVWEGGRDVFITVAALMFLAAGILELFTGPKRRTDVRPHS